MTTILAVPGIARVGPEFLRGYEDMVVRRGWHVDGPAVVISHESGFRPEAHNPQPGQTATGLIQFIESTARMLGTTTAALARMTAVEQLPYVERFFVLTLGKRQPALPEDFILATYGRPELIGRPDDSVVDRRDSSDPKEATRYRVNHGLDGDQDGVITVGDMRRSVRRLIAAAGGRRVTVSEGPAPAHPVTSGGEALLAVTVVVGAVAAWWRYRHG